MYTLSTYDEARNVQNVKASEGRIHVPTVLKRLREGSGLSQTEMAKRLSISLSRYNKIEHGNRPASPDIVRVACRILGVDEGALFLPSSYTLRRIDPLQTSPSTQGGTNSSLPAQSDRKRGEQA